MDVKVKKILESCAVPGQKIYFVGTFDDGITLLSQQIRSLNLVWALTEANIIPTLDPGRKKSGPTNFKIAIVGAGFAGLTAAAGLIRKGVMAEITLFEQRDTLFPLQHGSDTRWLHPNIYNWPAEGSLTNAAMLPLINWTAARASDVVVQVMAQWKDVIENSNVDRPLLYCNTGHLQIGLASIGNKVQVEWIGEPRDPATGNPHQNSTNTPLGTTRDFDLLILTVGFGLEKGKSLSYWRNDTVAQPNLEQPRLTYLVSGQGDSAMIDLLRLRISHYRQDRILGELFSKASSLLSEIREIYDRHEVSKTSGIFESFDALAIHPEFANVIASLVPRLRRDTVVILQIRFRKLSQLFESTDVRISFQNKLLVFLLYKCGGFVPSVVDEKNLVEQHSITPDHVIRRYGTRRVEQLESILSRPLFQALNIGSAKPYPTGYLQGDKMAWPGGYFGHSGATVSLKKAKPTDPVRETWRKEYLPDPTELAATTFCAAVAGMLAKHHPTDERLRVTLHRAIHMGEEELLQQCCEYFGVNIPRPDLTSARTFPAKNATIGLAYMTRKIVRSKKNVDKALLDEAMKELDLNAASRAMSNKVRFLLGVPILEPAIALKFTAPSPVAGVLFIDSTAPDFFLDDNLLSDVVSMTGSYIFGLEQKSSSAINRIVNLPLSGLGKIVPKVEDLSTKVSLAFEVVVSQSPPTTENAFQFNFEYTDFVPVVA